MEDSSMIIVYVDGLTEPVNPGGVGAVGFAAYRDGERIYSMGRIVGEGPGMSNNRAEYEALCEALRWLVAKNLSNEKILVKSDSRLLVNQMLGKWKIKDGLYLVAYKKARCLANRFIDLSFEWVSREMNEEADSLTREAYRGYVSKRHSRHG
jgi:ribonuclease HI